jgi:hypothetical protein
MAAIGGLSGFFVLLIARTVVFAVTVMSGSIFGGSSLSAGESLIIFGFVPILISLGAAIPAWALGSDLWGGILAGVIATSVVLLIHAVGNPVYSPFNSRERLEFVSAIGVSVLISVFRRGWLPLGNLAVLLTLIILFLALTFVIPGNEIELNNIPAKVGFVLSLLAWLTLPYAAALITVPDQTTYEKSG